LANGFNGSPGRRPDFLFVYVLTGWMSLHYQGHGEHRLKAGDCDIIPPARSHNVTGWSEDGGPQSPKSNTLTFEIDLT
jgi:hypothetical protein